ncbi:MAG TPA: hypothetical protein PLL06_15745 [Acidobacteriota bacterium]|nr:hypothetical protein [Acidobacteriota bacterium]HNB73144.1 hypothetical protein [Acidobacteriota bacterium]
MMRASQSFALSAIRYCLVAAVFIIVSAIYSEPAKAVTLVFVHGKGDAATLDYNYTLQQYWTPDMIKAATRNYATPYLVVTYDGRQAYWDAAGEVARECNLLLDQGKKDLVFVTHSMGGCVMRYILCNADPSDPYYNYNGNYNRIQANTVRVLSYAPPNAGSEAADLAGSLSSSFFTAWIVSLLNQDYPSTQCLTTANVQYANNNWFRDSLRSKPIYSVAGTGLWNDFCLECVGLATLSGLAGLPGEDDGAVAQYSAHKTGAPGYDWYNTDANHHYNRRNSYRKLGEDIANYGY